VERFADATLLRVTLETGRRNQIRVHMAELGHPVLGDVRYQVERAKHPLWRESRLALHAAVLGFTHPTTGQHLRFEAPPPACFERFLKDARARVGPPGGSSRGPARPAHVVDRKNPRR
jgi:23S rRNA pseudouridine1911/1915/1917 synthase